MTTGDTFRLLQRAVCSNKLLSAILMTVVVIAVTATTIIGYQLLERDRSISLSGIGNLLSERITRQVSTWLILPRMGGDYFEVVGSLGPIQMLEFETRLKVNFPAVQYVSFARKVPGEERPRYVSYMRSLGFTDYEINDLTSDMRFVKSPTRQEYFPVYMQGTVGWDMSSDSQLEAMVNRLRDSGRPSARVLTQPIGVVPGPGLVVLYPVFGTQSAPVSLAARRQEFTGMFVVSFDPAVAVGRAIRGLEDQVEVELHVDPDIGSGADVTSLYKSAKFDEFDGPVQKDVIPVSGEVWTLQVKATPELQGSVPPWLHLAFVLIIGLAALLIATVILFLVQERKDQTEVSQQLREMAAAKDRFLSTISHELKTPLTSILAFADILKKNRAGHLDSKELKQLEIISRNSEHLDFLIDDVLEVSRLHTETLRLTITDFEVREFVSDVRDELEPILTNKDQLLIVTFNIGELRIPADRHRLEQVLSNLISNASKYSGAGSDIWLTVEAADGQIQFTIRDQGIGIPPDNLDDIGTPFFRVESDECRMVSGTGLGIYVTKAIVDLHGGTFELSSELGFGTTVVLRFPIADQVEYPAVAATISA